MMGSNMKIKEEPDPSSQPYGDSFNEQQSYPGSSLHMNKRGKKLKQNVNWDLKQEVPSHIHSSGA